ncbi:uroporphyrinogen-III C-methyltransferase [Mangrovimicrobium sediminis]|uniref:Siroheme synthase n=1 Tax=Mangrovimicrobium sediminis TaxID=2562682 RepID=A0A4Z0M799_9GAMM|nr:siroheme synthase CysG [Haliea sp. SAOS-164]TGD75288.1 uroporphyrinogen-III C-methyltransferase [Haliea sp. SAOS-164]
MRYLPVCLDLHGARVTLVGAGTVATRKARLLARAGAQLQVVAPDIAPGLTQLLTEHGGHWREGEYRDADLEGSALAVAATPSSAVNAQVSRDATARGLPVNVVDSPDLCTFIFPSIVDRDPLIIAVSSSGQSPVLARLMRRKIESLVPAAYGRLARFAGRLRDTVKTAIPADTPRRLFWEQVMEGAIAEQVLVGREERAQAMLEERLADTERLYTGEVYLVGAGPGDPDLMTFKAVRLLQSADVVLYDRLVSEPILEMARRDAKMIYVGKQRDDHAVPQEQINQLLLELALAGNRVVRLKGGDPFIFGRGGEEIDQLAAHQVPFQVVPGITAASGAACYAGIPLTHRDHAQSVRFVTGHRRDGSLDLPWESFRSSNETLVFYMGLVGLPEICAQLIAHGRRPETPVALVERATFAEQRVLAGTLQDMPAIVEREQPRAPTLIIVGDVVKLRDSLAWFGGGAEPA